MEFISIYFAVGFNLAHSVVLTLPIVALLYNMIKVPGYSNNFITV